jgi:hypothetical protein
MSALRKLNSRVTLLRNLEEMSKTERILSHTATGTSGNTALTANETASILIFF